MSVHTTADELRSKVKEHLTIAHKQILEILNEDTWGHGDISKDYLDTLHEVAIEIFKLKHKL